MTAYLPSRTTSLGALLLGLLACGADRADEPPRAAVTIAAVTLPPAGEEGITSTTREYDANGMLASETVDGVTTSYTYNADGDVATVTRPGNKITRYTNYKRGVAQREDHPEGVVIQRVVDDFGDTTSETDGEQKTVLYDRDALGRVDKITYPQAGSSATLISYSDTGASVERGTYVEGDSYDGFGRQISRSTSTTVTSAFDGLGRKTFDSDPGVTTGTTMVYDYLGRMSEVTHADNSKVVYTYQATSDGVPQVAVTDERGFTTVQSMRELAAGSFELMKIDAPESAASVDIRRNVRGQLLSVVQGGMTRSYHYDEHYYLVGLTEPETGETVIGRDLAGNMTSHQVGTSGKTTFVLDDLYRVKDIQFPDATRNIHQTWDRNSRLTSASTAASTRSWGFDDNGNLLEDRLVVGGQTFVIGYAYNGRDQRTTINYPMAGTVVSLSPDRDGRPRKVGAFADEIALYPNGQPQTIKYPGKVTYFATQDNRQRADKITVKYSNLSTNVFLDYVDMKYGYDLADNVASVTDAQNASNNRVYGYDAIDRLTSVAINGGASMPIHYDGVGNIKDRAVGGTLTYTYDPSSNRLASTSGVRAYQFSYDTRGNVTSNGAINFQYDDRSMLRCARCGSADEVRYDYDATGTRISRTKGGGTVYEIHDSAGNLLLEVDPASGQRQEHFYLGRQRVATNGTNYAPLGKVVYYQNDLGGSPLTATDAAGTLLWRESYLPYGEQVLKPAAASANRQWFHGKKSDDVSGLADFGARNYDPVLGRFLSVDPQGFSDHNLHSFNRYAYGNNNPLKFRDPDGRSPTLLPAFGELALWVGTRIMMTRYGPALLAGAAAFGAQEFGYGVTRFPLSAGTLLPIVTRRGLPPATALSDEASMIAEVVGDPNAYAQITRTLQGITAWALYRGEQPAGTGPQLLATVIRAAGGLRAGQQLKLTDIINPETVAVFKAGGAAAESLIGRTAARALNQLGLIGKNFRWELEGVEGVAGQRLSIIVDID